MHYGRVNNPVKADERLPRSAAHLYVPADNRRLVESALRRRVATVILDLEDAVSPARKEQARDSLGEQVASLRGSQRIWIRVNEGEDGLADLAVLVSLDIAEGFWIPKSADNPHFHQAVRVIRDAGAKLGIIVESARGILEISSLLDGNPGAWLQVGAVDLRADIGMAADSSIVGRDLDPILTTVLLAARRFEVAELVAPVTPDFHDLAHLSESSRHLADLGFTSRACIHPNQIDPIDQVFVPTYEDLRRARHSLRAFADAAKEGMGAYVDHDNRMADAATVRSSRALIERFGRGSE